MGIDQLARLFALIDERSVSTEAARKTVDRWIRAGWANAALLIVGQPVFVWLTRDGLSQAGLNYRANDPTLATLAHCRDVAGIRLDLVTRYPQAYWRSERAIAHTLGPRVKNIQAPHLPDAEFVRNGHIVAIERERTPKTIDRTRRIMLGLLSRKSDYAASAPPPDGAGYRYTSLWYFTTAAAHSAVVNAAAQLPPDLAQRLRIFPW